MTIAALFTAYNEEKIIGELIERTPDNVVPYVIDDGSTDRTADIARERGARVITHVTNLGQGMALITGFKVIVEAGYDIVVELDGDGQHRPEEIPEFVRKIEKSGKDMVAGSRLLGSNYEGAPFSRNIGLAPLKWFLDLTTGYHLSDYMCGFRAFRGAALKKVAPLFDDLFETEYIASEMWIKFAHAGLTATEIPINMKARVHGTSYKGHAFARYGFGVFRTICRAVLDTYKER